MTYALAPCFVLGLLSAAAPGQAQSDTTSSLSWVRRHGAETCLSTQAMARKVERLLGRTVFVSAADADISVEVELSGAVEKAGFNARMVISEPSGRVLGQRELASEGAECTPLTDQLALVIALTVDPSVSFVELPQALAGDANSDPAEQLLNDLPEAPSSAGAAAQQSPQRDAQPRASASDAEASEPAEPLFSISAGAALGTGWQPSVSFGPSLDLLWRAPSLRLSLLWWPERTQPIGARGQLIVAHWQASLAWCPQVALDGGLRLCGGIASGLIRARAEGAPLAEDETRPTFGLRLGSHLEFPFATNWAARLSLELGVPLIRDRFRYLDEGGAVGAAFAMDSLVGMVGIGASWLF